MVISLLQFVNSTDVEYITFMVVNPDSFTRKLVSLAPQMLTEIENYRFENRIRTESEAIRQLIQRGLNISVDELIQDCVDRQRPDIADLLRELAKTIQTKKRL